MTKYKCPNCNSMEGFDWTGEDDVCECDKCGKLFHACDCEVKK